MGFATKKRLYRHMAFAHNVDPALEDNEANRDLILNPPPLDLSEADCGKKSRRGRRKGAKNRLKLDPDTGQLVRTLIKRPRKQSPSSKKLRALTSSVTSGASTSNITSHPSTHHSHPTLASVSAEESILLTDPASLWSAAMASWPPVTVAPPTFP